ncbi:uncharacterized protein EI97DRAFT_363207, partial [Westerdykella ornata]
SRRQPQVSCDSCRQKKLKCDRRDPCSSCRARGLDCTGQLQPLPTHQSNVHVALDATSTRTDESILGRLAALEQAVFGSSKVSTTSINHSSPSFLHHERHRAAKFLDSAYNSQQTIATDSVGPYLDASHIIPDTTSGSNPQWLVSQTDALSLLHDFFDNAYHLLPIVHMAVAEKLIGNFYSQLASGGDTEVNLAHAALILSISATSAYFWNSNDATTCQHGFESAAQASLTWRQSALDALDKCQRAGSSSLEEAQARAIVAALVYNAEGQSTRFRLLHSGSVAACREMGVHLVDSPGFVDSTTDDHATREIKRRLWWHVTATDWMLALNGGPLDGTYTIHPRHMNVAKPRNLNDEDLAKLAVEVDGWAHPQTVPTQMSCFLHRIRLAEVCRAVVDARTPGLPDVEDANYDQVLALDLLFERALAEFPPFMSLDAPMPPGAPRFLPLQRALVHLGFHSRRARLHRPFLLCKDDDEGYRYRKSREICLRSARIVLDISTGWLEQSLAERHHPQQHSSSTHGPPIHRLGTVVNHMFMACAVLALAAKGSSDPERMPKCTHAGMDEIHKELKRARHLLAAAGKESIVARGLGHGLTAVLKRYRVKG